MVIGKVQFEMIFTTKLVQFEMIFTTKIPTDRKLDVVAKVSDKRKAKVRTTSTSLFN